MGNSDSDSRSNIETRQFTFAELPDYSEISAFKPQGFRTPEGNYKISSWRDVYRIFCRYLLRVKPRHIRAFKNLEETFLGRRIMFSNDPSLLNEAYQLRSGFYAEIFLPPKSMIHNISRLIQFCRLSPRQFVITIPFYVDESELSEPEEVEDEQDEVNSQLAQPEQSLSQSAYFKLNANIPDLAFSKPVSITINSRRYSVSQWRDIISETARYIYENETESFRRYLYDNYGPKGSSSPLFSDKRSDLRQACRIDSNLYVETNFSSEDCVKMALLFMRYTNIAPSKVQIEYLPAGAVNSDNSTPAESANTDAQPEEELEDSAVVDNDAFEQSQTETAIESEEDNDNPSADDSKSEEFENDKEWDFANDDDFFDIGMEFTDDGLPVLTSAHKKLIDAIEEKFPKGIDIDNEDSVRTLELASGVQCNEYILDDLRMILAYNKADNVFYVPKRLADESTVKSMAAFIDQSVDQYNAVSLSIIREKFQDQLNCECDDEELLEFIEWYVYIEMEHEVAIDYNDAIGDGVCLPRSITTEEFCEIFYGQIKKYLEKTDSPVPISQLRQLYPSLNETIISYALSDDSFGSGIQEETKDGQLFYSICPDSQINDEAADELEPASECETLSFTLDDPIPDLSFTKPTSISFGEQIDSISSWTGVLTQTAIYIAQNEPDVFYSLVEQYGQPDSKPRLFSRAKFEKLTCKQINSDYYLNTNFSASSTVKHAQMLLQSCMLPLSQVRIEYYSAGAGTQRSRGAGGSLQVAADNTSFTKPVNKSMFNTCIVVPTQCHNAFYSNLTNVPEAGTSVPVTIWLNGSSYSAAVQNPDFSVCGAPPQVRFTWNPSSPIAQALKMECPDSYQLFQSGARVSSQDVPDSVTVSCGNKPDEFIIQVNSQKTSEGFQEETVQQDDNSKSQEVVYYKYQPEAVSERLIDDFGFSPEERKEVIAQIEELVPDAFPNGSCRDSQLQDLLNRLNGQFSDQDALERFVIDNNLAVECSGWVYFLVSDIKNCLNDVLRQLQQEGQVLAFYDNLWNKKSDVFTSVNVYKDKELLSKLFTALKKDDSQSEIDFYPTENWVTLKENGSIKDALINAFSERFILTYEQLKELLPYIPFEEFKSVILSDSAFIRDSNGSYTLRDKIWFDSELRDKLISLIQSEIEKKEYISCNELDFSKAKEFNPQLSDSALLDYFCQELLPKRFKRKGKIISDSEKPLNSSSIFRNYCQSKRCVTCEELKSLASDLGAMDQTAFEIAIETLVRIDTDRFVDPKLIHFDVDEIDKVLETFIQGDFIPLQDVYTFSPFPTIDAPYSWNWFLLESYCRKYSKLFGFMVAVPNNKNVGVIVRKSANFDSYYALMANAVVKSGIELTENAVGGYLFNGHYIALSNATLIKRVIENAHILRDRSEV